MTEPFNTKSEKNSFERNEISRHTQMKNIVYVGQSFWYILTIVIYLGCTLMGFGIAYLIVRVLVDMKIN